MDGAQAVHRGTPRALELDDEIVAAIARDALDHRVRVFDPFHRAGGKTGRGSGLGLATVRSIESDHGGDVRLEASPDGGTDAVVTLPVA